MSRGRKQSPKSMADHVWSIWGLKCDGKVCVEMAGGGKANSFFGLESNGDPPIGPSKP